MSRVMTIGDLRKATAGVNDDAEVFVYGRWNSFTLVRKIAAHQQEMDSMPGSVIFRDPYRLQQVARDAGWKQLPSGSRGYANLQAGDQKMIEGGKHGGVLLGPPDAAALLPSQSRQLGTLAGRQRPAVRAGSNASRVMTVGDLKGAIAGVAHDTELYVYGGEMNTSTHVREIVTDMRDVDYNRPAAVIFRDPYRPQDIGAGFKQLPPGTRGYEDLQPRDQKIIDDQLPWWIRWLLK